MVDVPFVEPGPGWGHSVQGGKVVLFYDGGDMEIVTQAFDSKMIGEAVMRLVKTYIGGGEGWG